MGIRQELDVADLQNHVQGELVADLLENAHRLFLRRRQGWDEALARETFEAAHVVWIPLGVDSSIGLGLQVEDACADPLLLSFASLPLAIKVPDGLDQRLELLRMMLLEVIEDVMRRGNVALSSLQRSCDAEQAHDVRIVGMEELACVGPVDSDFVNLRRIVAQVFDVAENVAVAILRDKVAQVCPETHVSNGALVQTPFVRREALEEDETLSVEEVFSQGQKHLRHDGEGKVGLRIDQ